MEGQLLAENLELKLQQNFWSGISREDARKLLKYISALEKSMADLLRATCGKSAS